jgi:uracil phosphoribosyltransferase
MFVLNKENSIANQFLAELRNVHIQTDRMRFRKNQERLGELLAYELSKNLVYLPQQIQTPLQEVNINVLAEQPVILTILRAGIPFFQGFLNIFDHAPCGFIGAYRAPHTLGEDFQISMDYMAIPAIDNKEVILVDTMLATGKSLIKTITYLRQYGQPKHIHLVSAIAAPEGVLYVQNNLDKDYSIWTCALDDRLNENAYIIPGLGDAGDLSFGSKL